jgi:predicted permease
LNVPVLLFTLATALAVGTLFGLAPALKTSKVDLEGSLKEGSRGSTGSHHRLQSGLVIAQVASTLVLLVGAGLLFRTIRHLWESDPGFDTQHVIAFKVELSPSVSKSGSAMRVAYRQLLERLRTIPGVQAADFTLLLPLSSLDNDCPFWIGPRQPALRQAAPRMLVFNTGPDYLRTMGIPLIRGRFFTPQDTIGSPCVAAIDTVFARTYFHDHDPLGQTLTFGWTPPLGPCRIVGVVGHVKHWGLGDEKLTQAQSYYPLYQIADEWLPIGRSWTSIIVRTKLDPEAVMPAIKRAVYGPGGDQPVYEVQTMQDIAAESMASQRFPMVLLGLFAGLALLLAAVGIYGMFSYSVTQRVHEIGIRMALGAHQQDVLRLVIGQGLRLAAAGLAIGAAAALILARLLPSFSHLLYRVKASDPITFGVVSVLLIGVAILACYIPAHRAAKVDPMVALRHE